MVAALRVLAQRLALLIHHHIAAQVVGAFAGKDAGINDVEVQLFQDCRGGGKEGGTVAHVDDDVGVTVRGATGGIADHHQWVRVVPVADDRSGLPDDIHGGILQEEVIVQGVPDRINALVAVPLCAQHVPGFFAGGADPVIPVEGAVDALAQDPTRLDVELAQQRVPPGVPQARVGGGDIADRQDVQVDQVNLGRNLAREFTDDGWIRDVALLGGERHQQVVFNQPRYQLGIPVAQVVALTEPGGINGAEFRVVTRAALGHIMEQAGDVKELRLGKLMAQP